MNLTWAATPTPLETRVTRADAPKLLEYHDIRWELEANDDLRAPEERTIAAGRAILEAGARGEYSDLDDDDEHLFTP